MPLLTPSSEKETHILRATIDKELFDKINSYLECAKINKIDEFIEKAVEFLFKKDKEFRKYLKEKNKGKDVKVHEVTGNLSTEQK